MAFAKSLAQQFLSTPSARRATSSGLQAVSAHEISIHALREEGDRSAGCRSTADYHFYPRPPRGGRPANSSGVMSSSLFLSTPSARRATRAWPFDMVVLDDFYPRPPRGGRQTKKHSMQLHLLFLSTPSARRATLCR